MKLFNNNKIQKKQDLQQATQTKFNFCFGEIGPHKVVIEDTKKGIDIKTIGGSKIVSIYDNMDGRGIQVDAAKHVFGRVDSYNPLAAPSYSDETRMIDSEFEPLASNDDLAKDLLRLKKG